MTTLFLITPPGEVSGVECPECRLALAPVRNTPAWECLACHARLEITAEAVYVGKDRRVDRVTINLVPTQESENGHPVPQLLPD